MKSTDSLNKFGTLIGASASSADIATIPAAQATAGDGTASIALAFPPETFVAREAGGEPPRGQDMNGFLNLLSAAIQPLQAGFLGTYDADFASAIGGYPSGAIVSGSSVGTFWVSTADNNTTVPGDDGASWQSLFIGLATTNDLTSYVSGTYGKSSTDYQMLGLYQQSTTGRPVAVFNNGTTTVYNGIANYTDVTTEASAREAADTSIQTNLTNFQTSQAATNAEFSSDISDCVSGIYGKSSTDYQMLGLYQQGTTGRPVAVFNNGTTTVYNGIANYTDVTTEASAREAADTSIQTNLTQAISNQSDVNSSVTTALAAKVGTNASNDGTNSPVSLFNYFISTGVPWISGDGFSTSLVKTSPASGYYQLENFVTDENHALIAQDSTGSYSYAPSSSGTIAASGNITGGYWTKIGNILRQVIFLEKLIDNPVVTFPTAYSAVPCVTFGASTEYTTQNTAFANIQRDTNDNLLLSATGCTLHISRGAPDVAVSGDGVDVWMSLEGPVAS